MLSPSNEQQDVLRSITTTTTTSNNNGDVSSLAAILTQEDERSPLFVESDDDVGSEPVNSPSSITSPPYWVQVHSRGTSDSRPDERPGTGRHSRAVSNVSFESMLSREAITLQDNEREEDDDDDERPGSRSNVSGRDRNRACWAKSVQITDSVLVNGSATNIGAFVVWNIRVETLNVCFFSLLLLYSDGRLLPQLMGRVGSMLAFGFGFLFLRGGVEKKGRRDNYHSKY